MPAPQTPAHGPRRAWGLLALGMLLATTTGRAQTFVDRTAGSGLEQLPMPSLRLGSGLCTADFDGDGLLDLVVPGPTGSPLRLLLGQGAMRWVDHTAGSGLLTCGDVRAVLAADIDNDGDQDLLVCNWWQPCRLFVNDGGARFADEATVRGIVHISSSFSASFGDFDRDGWLDLYVGNHATRNNNAGEPNVLYRNTGDGHFVDVSAQAGVDHRGMTMSAPFVDFDQDGWPDLWCVNDKGTSRQPNELYRNRGDGTFVPVAATIGADLRISGMGTDFTDVFGDGGVDLFCTDTPPDHALLVWDPQASRYTDETWRRSLQGLGVGWSAHWWDFDNDGHQDLHVVHHAMPNAVYHNPGTGHGGAGWSEQGFSLGLAQIGAKYNCLIADFDDDGGLDVLQRYQHSQLPVATPDASLHRNQLVRGHHLRVRLHGTASNKDGIGAAVELQVAATRQRQFARSGTGYLTGNDHRLHFGLGDATVVDQLTVRWPSGIVLYETAIPADRTIDVVEPSLTLRRPALLGTDTWLDLRIASDHGLPYAMALSLQAAPGTALPDGTRLPIVIDGLAAYTLFTPNNALLLGSQGTLDQAGRASARLSLPDLPALAGLVVHATAMTFDPPRFPWLRTVFPRSLAIRLQ